jgi:hypothetical protein
MSEEIKQQETADDEFLFDELTDADYIAAAYNAVGALDSFDAINKEDKATKKRIFRRCLFIIDTCTKNLYDQLTDDELEED